MALKTRRPTGAVPWPLILLEGGEKVGKGWACAVLSASPKIGRTVVLDLNEGAWDEYGLVPGARFEIAEHDGSWASVFGAVTDAKEEAAADAAAGKPPFVLVVDGETAIWESLKDWGGLRARTSRANRAKLEKDPNAEITIPMNIWNDVNSRHRRLMNVLMTFPGVVVITARGGAVAAVEGGQPVEGKKTYRVEGNKSIGYDVSVWVRLSRDDKPVVVGARSVHAGVRPGIDPPKTLPDDWTLEWLIFGALKCDPVKAHVRDVVEMVPDAMTPEQIRDEALTPRTGRERLGELWTIAKQSGYEDVTVVNEVQGDELLMELLARLGNEKKQAAQPQQPPTVPAAAPGPVRDEVWLDAALANAPVLPDLKACQALWRESAAKVHAGEVAKGDAERVQEILRARMADLRNAPDALDPADPWAVKVEALVSDEEAGAAVTELAGLLRAGQMEDAHADRVFDAIRARFPKGADEARAVAA